MSSINEQAYQQWNGGAVHAAGSDNTGAFSQQSNPNADGHDVIREGKQKAKDIMAAAGVQPGTPSGQQSQLPGMANGAAQANGVPQMSRKRSRDGSQKPMAETSSSTDANASSHDEVLLDRYIQCDMLHGVAMNDQAKQSRDLLKAKQMEREFYEGEVLARRRTDPGSIFGYGYMGYGNGITNGASQILYTSQRGPPKGRRNLQVRISRKDNTRQAEEAEELVPLRLDVELDKLRLRDTFTWNLHERTISPDQFADYLLEDLKIPPENVAEVGRAVKSELHEQLQGYYPHPYLEDEPLEPGRPYSEHKDDEMRIMIKLNITIGRIHLMDQFEWDLNNPHNLAEEFARQMALENALSGEFTTAIAHSIREQCQLYTKSLYLTNHPFDGRPIEDPDVRDAFLPAPIHSAFRPQGVQRDWTLYMYEMSEAELERTETSMLREHRAQKRQLNRRGGPALPDLKDRQRTVRSLIMHTVIPGAVETFETTGIPKTRRGGRTRRSARNDGDDSDDLDSEESGLDSPAPSAMNAGTARTRGMRGAATAAQAAMRASNYGARSTTPEVALATPHETKTSRRSMLREESVLDDSDHLIVKLRISRPKLKAWWDEYRAKKRASEYPLSGYASQPAPAASLNPRGGTPSRGVAGGLSTPSMTPRSLPQSRNTPQPNGSTRAATSSARQTEYDDVGRVTVDTWPAPDQAPPPPPTWLNSAIQTMRQKYPESDFEPTMRPSTVDAQTGKTARIDPLAPGDRAPPGIKLQYVPRIRCNDCPGKLYTASPGSVIEQFDVHLRNRLHRANVERRERGEPTR